MCILFVAYIHRVLELLARGQVHNNHVDLELMRIVYQTRQLYPLYYIH